MTHLDILLPFGLPQSEMASSLVRECHAPALAMLLARSRTTSPLQELDPFSRALPHEHWLAERFGLPASDMAKANERGNSPAVAAVMSRRLPSTTVTTEGYWFVVQPAHIHIARDHLVLTNIHQLELSDAESRRLFDSIFPLCQEIGHTLLYVDAATWLLRADDWAGLRTSTPEAASGRNIDIWMPEGPGELAWRKLQNEIQMQWFAESLNDEREQNGKKPVNSLWIWGGADISAAQPTAALYQSSFNLNGWPQALAVTEQPDATPGSVLASPAERGLLLLDDLSEPGLTNEWGHWLQRVEALDRDWFAPLLQALRCRQLSSLSLVLTGQDKLQHVTATLSSLRKFWVKPTLSKLAI